MSFNNNITANATNSACFKLNRQLKVKVAQQKISVIDQKIDKIDQRIEACNKEIACTKDLIKNNDELIAALRESRDLTQESRGLTQEYIDIGKKWMAQAKEYMALLKQAIDCTKRLIQIKKSQANKPPAQNERNIDLKEVKKQEVSQFISNAIETKIKQYPAADHERLRSEASCIVDRSFDQKGNIVVGVNFIEELDLAFAKISFRMNNYQRFHNQCNTRVN